MSDHIAHLTRYSGKGPMLGICLVKIHQVTSAEQHPLGPHYHNGWVIARWRLQ